MPITDEARDRIKGATADINNAGNAVWGGSI